MDGEGDVIVAVGGAAVPVESDPLEVRAGWAGEGDATHAIALDARRERDAGHDTDAAGCSGGPGTTSRLARGRSHRVRVEPGEARRERSVGGHEAHARVGV